MASIGQLLFSLETCTRCNSRAWKESPAVYSQVSPWFSLLPSHNLTLNQANADARTEGSGHCRLMCKPRVIVDQSQ